MTGPAAVWLPALLDGRDRSQLRVAPVSHGGQLLGLIVVERPGDADAFPGEERSGHGFVNMAGRLGAIGGAVRWEPRPGRGSAVSGSVPVT